MNQSWPHSRNVSRARVVRGARNSTFGFLLCTNRRMPETRVRPRASLPRTPSSPANFAFLRAFPSHSASSFAVFQPAPLTHRSVLLVNLPLVCAFSKLIPRCSPYRGTLRLRGSPLDVSLLLGMGRMLRSVSRSDVDAHWVRSPFMGWCIKYGGANSRSRLD